MNNILTINKIILFRLSQIASNKIIKFITELFIHLQMKKFKNDINNLQINVLSSLLTISYSLYNSVWWVVYSIHIKSYSKQAYCVHCCL